MNYARPSARAKVTLNDELTIPQALLDNGSELNIVPKRTVDQLSYPIDVDVQWVINGYNEKAKSELKTWKEEGEVLGVMHDVNVDVGGVQAWQRAELTSNSARLADPRAELDSN